MGSGKSHYVVSQLPSLRGKIYTNLPITDACPREVIKVDTDTVFGWIMDGKRIEGPGYLILDEAHFLFGTGLPAAQGKAVKEWITLTRKRGIKIWLLTQGAEQLSRTVARLADFERLCYTRANEPDPVFGLTVDDWNQIKAKLTGKYTPVTWIEEFSAVGKTRRSLGHKPHVLSDKIYGWYDSYGVDNETDTGDLGVKEEQEYKILSWRDLILGILRRNWLYFLGSHVTKVLLIAVVAYLFAFHYRDFMAFVSRGVVMQQQVARDGTLPTETTEEKQNVTIQNPINRAPVAREQETAPARVNRVGTMLLTAGRLYDATAIYRTAVDGTRTGLYPSFGKARGTGRD